MKCKFCGCTDDRPCRIPVTTNGEEVVVAFPPGIALGFLACSWLLPNVCSAPSCVDQAYMALRITPGIGLELVAS